MEKEKILQFFPGFKHVYIDPLGNVWELKERKLHRIKTYMNKAKQEVVKIRKGDRLYLRGVANAVLTAYGPEKKDKNMVVGHKDGNNSNNVLTNLFWRSRGEIMGRKGSPVIGEHKRTREVKEWSSAVEASKELNMTPDNVRRSLYSYGTDKRYSAGGYFFKHKDKS